MKDGHFAITVLPPEDNLQSDVEDNLVEVDEMRFVEGNVMEKNSDNEREEYREELMVTVVPMSEIRSKVTDEDSDDLDDPSDGRPHSPQPQVAVVALATLIKLMLHLHIEDHQCQILVRARWLR